MCYSQLLDFILYYVVLRYRFIVHIKVEAYAFGNPAVKTRSAIVINGIDSGIISRGFHVVVLSDADRRI